MAVDDAGESAVGGPLCNYIDCVVDEPDNLVHRSLKGADYEAYYCEEHDPLDDPEVRMMWEAGDDE